MAWRTLGNVSFALYPQVAKVGWQTSGKGERFLADAREDVVRAERARRVGVQRETGLVVMRW